MTEKIRIPIVVEGFGTVETQLDTVAKKLDQVGQSAKRTNESVGSSATSNAIRNASFQMTDFVVQVQGGTAASLALGQQLPQLLAGFGTMGAVAGVAAAVLPTLVAAMGTAKDKAVSLDDAVSGLDLASSDFQKTIERFDLTKLIDEFNKSGAAARVATVEVKEFQLALDQKRLAELRGALTETSQKFTDFTGLFSSTAHDQIVKFFDYDKLLGDSKSYSQFLEFQKEAANGTLDLGNAFSKYRQLFSSTAATKEGEKFAEQLKAFADGTKDAAAAEKMLDEMRSKVYGGTVAGGTLPKKRVETPLEKLQFEARAADAGIAPQTLKEIDALNEGMAKRNIGMTEYLRLAGVAMANDPVIAKNAKAVADQLKEEAQTQALLNDYRANNAVILERIDREAELAAMSDRQRLIAEAMYRAEDEARKLRERIIQQVKDETAQKQALAGVEAELADQKGRVAEAAARSYDVQRTFEFGWNKAFQSYADNASNASKSAQEAFQQATSAMEDALTRFAITGKISFSSLANSIIADIIRMQARAAVSGIMGQLGGLVGGLFSSGSSATGLASLPASVNKTFALGGVESSPSLSAYSGSIVSKPTIFPFAKGVGLMGEAGAEGIFPLKRGKDGKLGVSAEGNGGNVTVNIIQGLGTQAKQSERSDGRGGKIIDVLIEQVESRLSSNIAMGNGPVPAALQSTYGLNRAAGAY